MASVFKRKRRVGGRRMVAKKYTVEWRDADGQYHRQLGFTDKAESWALAKRLEEEAQCSHTVRHQKTPLLEHLEAFRRSLEAKERSPKHVRITCNRIKSLLEGCGFVQAADADISSVEEWLDEQRTLRIGVKTRNYYVAAVRQFFSWLVRAKRATQNPLADLEKLNTETDVRRKRRVLAQGELWKLIDATRRGKPFRGVVGEDRAVLYLLAVRTGLRASECASLTPESLDLKAFTVTVEAVYSKRRRTDTLPLRADLAELLAGWLQGRSGPLWPGTWLERSARMIRQDLEAVGIAYKNEDGVFDFHALRHQFLSDLARSGVHPKVAQELARHSTICLTMDRYSHVLDEQKAKALESLPSFGEWTEKWTGAMSAEGHGEAQPVTTGGEVPFPTLSMEPYVVSVVSTDCHESSLSDSSSGGRSRTYDTRIMIPLL
jgi:integrase